MIDWSQSAPAFQLAQMLILAASAVFIGSRFLPQHYRQRIGIATTICYLGGVAAFVIYLLLH